MKAMPNNYKHRSYSESHLQISHNEEKHRAKYTLKKKPIGKGTFSTVYYAKNADQIECAIKRISVKKLDVRRYDKFLLELKISQEISHPNIATCYEVFQTEKNWYIVSEYCSEGTLKKIIEFVVMIDNFEHKESTARYYLDQLKNALEYLHTNNIIHRDLKPDNILLTRDKESGKMILKLADFGFSRYFDPTEALMETGYDDLIQTICGSPIYMAPELLIKLKYNTKADIWSFGVIMYEMLHGKNPYYYAKHIQELRIYMESREIIYDDFSPVCINLLKSILEHDPIKRISWDSFFCHHWFSPEFEKNDYIQKNELNTCKNELDFEQEEKGGKGGKEGKEEEGKEEREEEEEKKEEKENIVSYSRQFPKTQPILVPIPKKKSEDDFIMIQNEESTKEQPIKMYNETYTSSIIKILTNSIVYVFGGKSF